MRRVLEREGWPIPKWLNDCEGFCVLEFKRSCSHPTKKVINAALDKMENEGKERSI